MQKMRALAKVFLWGLLLPFVGLSCAPAALGFPAAPTVVVTNSGAMTGILEGSVQPPVPGTLVRVFGRTIAQAIPNDSGEFSFPELPYGEYRVTILSPGHFAVSQRGDNRITLRAAMTEMDFFLHSHGELGEGFQGQFTLIPEIQGCSHRSPLEGQRARYIPALVTGVREFGGSSNTVREVYLQNPYPDWDERTSEGLYLITTRSRSGIPTVEVGDFIVILEALVEESLENYPSGSSYRENWTRTQVRASYLGNDSSESRLLVLRSGLQRPDPILLGSTGRHIPQGAFKISTEDAPLEPGLYSLDFWESLEHMLVRIPRPLVVGATDEFGVTSVLAEGGREIRNRSHDGSTLLRPDDANPEIIHLADNLHPLGVSPRGVRFQDDIVGIVDYSFRQYKVYPLESLPPLDHDLPPDRAMLVPAPGQLTVAGLNVENLAPVSANNGDPLRTESLARFILEGLHSPDILGLGEVQDNTGNLDDGTVAANRTLDELAQRINDLAQNPLGINYQWRQIDPQHNRDGGEPGGNIRVALMFNERRVSFVDRVPEPLEFPRFEEERSRSLPVEPRRLGGEWVLSHSPGRIEPDNPAWERTRIPLVGEFLFEGRRFFVVVNHWTAKGGDDPLQGRNQPPVLHSELRRLPQARIVADWARHFMDQDPGAHLILLGDFNDFHWSPPLQLLEEAGLRNLVWQVPEDRRFTYVYQGNAQILDNFLISPAWEAWEPEVEIVHAMTRLPAALAPTDHEPILARFSLNRFSGGPGAPLWRESYPRWEARAFRVVLDLALESPGRIYYGAVFPGQAAPNSREIREGRRSNGELFLASGVLGFPGGAAARHSLEGLQSGQDYDLWLATEDSYLGLGVPLRLSVATYGLDSRPQATDLFLSEVVEGSGNNKALEIANLTGAELDLAGWNLVKDNNGNGVWGSPLNLSGLLAPGEVLVIARSDGEPALVQRANLLTGSINLMQFNGNDQIALRRGSEVVDLFGLPLGGLDFAKDQTFVRSPLVRGPSSEASDPRTNGQWIQYPNNTFQELGRHSYDPD